MTDTAATAPPSERLRLYQSRHTIQMIPLEHMVRGYEAYCSVDGIRIFPVKGGRWRHDPDEIVKLMDVVHGGSWPTRDRAIERIVDTVATEEDEEFDREGQPEFNGAFR